MTVGQTTQNLADGGQTTHYAISYDDSLPPADGLLHAQQLLDHCEIDFDLMAGWFAGTSFEFSFPVAVHINTPAGPPAGGGAIWDDPPDIALPFGYSPTVQINAGLGASADFVRYLLVAEVTEMFMASKNNGWHEPTSLFSGADEGSKGEGLSRFLAFQFKSANGWQDVRYPNFEIVAFWLNPPGPPNPPVRPNYVDTNPDDTRPDVITGCTTCFLYYLHDQLGYGIPDIINAGASTLGGVYTNLTGKDDGWDSFISLVNDHYPPGPTYDPVTGDNIFPVPNLASLYNYSLLAGAVESPRVLALDTQTPVQVTVSLTSDNPAVLGVQPTVDIPAGTWSAAVSLHAAPVTGPAQAVTIHASYAGQTLSADVQILPRPSILAGHVTATASNPLNGASILIQSDTEIIPGSGNTLQLSTDVSGAYQSPAIPPHVYQISATADGYVPAAATVTVAEGVPLTTQDFALTLAVPFTVLGSVIDAPGAPLAGATVTLVQNAAVPGVLTATADASGGYRLTMDPGSYAGDYSLTASDAGYASASMTLTIPNGATLTENFVLAALGSLAGMVIDVSQTPAVPVADATVMTAALATKSDAAGHYQLTGLTPGSNDITVTAPGFDSADINAAVTPGTVTTQDLPLTEASAELTGTVTDGESSDPLPGATVSVAGAVSDATTATDGSYTVSGIPAGPARVTVGARFYFSQQIVAEFADYQTVQLDFSLDTRTPGKPPHWPPS